MVIDFEAYLSLIGAASFAKGYLTQTSDPGLQKVRDRLIAALDQQWYHIAITTGENKCNR